MLYLEKLKSTQRSLRCYISEEPIWEAKWLAAIVPDAAAQKLLRVGRLRVGLIYTRVRKGVKRRRCFKCLAFGHESGQCRDGPDRRNCCKRCGKTGNKAAGCSGTIEESRSFQKQLDKESNKTPDATTLVPIDKK